MDMMWLILPPIVKYIHRKVSIQPGRVIAVLKINLIVCLCRIPIKRCRMSAITKSGTSLWVIAKQMISPNRSN
jgi:hypothetical protein